MTRLVIAARYLTIIPIPGVAASTQGPGTAAAWFPVIGLAIGVLLATVDRLATAFFAPLLAALLTVTAWKLVTGGLHLDGLADCLDGLMGRDPAQRLAMMRDSRIGAFGAIGLVLFVMLETAAVSGIDPLVRGRALVLAPVVGRALPPLVARVFPPVDGGQGASFRAEVGTASVVLALVLALVAAVAAFGFRGLLALALAVTLALAVGCFMTRRLGGVSGDVHGAGVELGELVVLLTVAAAYPAR